MQPHTNLKDLSVFLADYATHLLGSGVHTSRVIRNSKRIGESQGVNINMTTFQKTMILTLHDKESKEVMTEVLDIPVLPINFEHNSELSSLSWEAYDKRLPLPVLREKYQAIITKPKMNPYLILLLVGLANASFCRLFGGDWGAVGIVFIATLIGFFTRQQMHRRHVNHFIMVAMVAFIASICASLGFLFSGTPHIALATSVLFLIPGVPLINGVIDIIEGHVLIGCSRLIQACLLVICIAVGLSCSLVILQNNLL